MVIVPSLEWIGGKNIKFKTRNKQDILARRTAKRKFPGPELSLSGFFAGGFAFLRGLRAFPVKMAPFNILYFL